MGSLTGLYGNRVAIQRRLNVFWSLKLSKLLQLDKRFWYSLRNMNRSSVKTEDALETDKATRFVRVKMISGCAADHLSDLEECYPFLKQNEKATEGAK